MSKSNKGLSEQQIKDQQTKKERKAARSAANQEQAKAKASAKANKAENTQENVEMTRTGEDPWKSQSTTDTNGKASQRDGEFIAQGRTRRESTYPETLALPPAKATVNVSAKQVSSGVITDQEMKDCVAKANPQNINDVTKTSATSLASQDPERVMATAKAEMEKSKSKTISPAQTGSWISRSITFGSLYLGHLLALLFLAFISGSTYMIQIMLTPGFLTLLFIGELILCKRLTTNNE